MELIRTCGPLTERRADRAECSHAECVERGARPDRGVPTMRTPGGLAELQGARESATAGRAEGRGRVHGKQVRSEERDGGRESRGHEEDVRRARRWDAEAGRVARGGGRHGRVAATGRGKGDGRTEHAGKVWKVSARPRTRGGRDRRQTKAADEDGNRRDDDRTAPHLTRRALLTPTPPMGAHSALASALPPLRPHAPCMCASARAPVLVRNGERTRATWGLRG